MATTGHRRKRSASDNILPTPQDQHPYLSGNFAPIQQTVGLTPCTHTGSIPEELAGGEYVRNGSNPVSNSDLGRDAHWFDGDGMLSGVSFTKDEQTGDILPEFVNQFILTDLYLSAISSDRLRVPILPSIATLVNPLARVIYVTLRIMRTIFLVIMSHLPGSKQKIKKISVANTSVVYHDGRAMALCESGPPMRIQLPGLDTVGWYNGSSAEGEPKDATSTEKERTLGDTGGMIQFMREWTTAHPKVDPNTKEMLMFHACFAPPYIQYSILPKQSTNGQLLSGDPQTQETQEKMLNAAVPGINGGRMMHDFGVSSSHTVIMDLPLSLDPANQLKGKPPVTYDSDQPSRFGIFPRRHPEEVRWFETDACCIFHTANSWDDLDATGKPVAVNMLACRLTSATMVFAAGNIAPPVEKDVGAVMARNKKRMPFFSKYDDTSDGTVWERSSSIESPSDEKEPLLRIISLDEPESPSDDEEEYDVDQCRLYYYNFDLQSGNITHQWALTAIPFEFPSVHPQYEMNAARYIYGCSTTATNFGSALGKATKIDVLVKIDAATLIRRGRANPPRSVSGIVDNRSMVQVLESPDTHDPVRAFQMPPGWYAQEPRFVPSASAHSEDSGYLVFYAFDEEQLTEAGNVPADDSDNRAKSELWIIDAKDMRTIIARVHLPQRVPYGLHGAWFSAEQVREQRPVESVRSTAKALEAKGSGVWMGMRDVVEKFLG